MNLLFYQPSHGGHHYTYLDRMLPGFVDLPIKLTLATSPQGHRSREYQDYLARYGDRLEVRECCQVPPKNVLHNGVHRALELIRCVREIRPDHVLVLYGDGLWQMLMLLWKLGGRRFIELPPVEVWLFRGGFSYPDADRPTDRIKRHLFGEMVRSGPFAALHLDDEYLFDLAQGQPRTGRSPRLFLTPNPIVLYPPMSKTAARERLGLPPDGRLIALFGMIDQRKGTDLLLQAFCELRQTEQQADVRLLLAGPHSEPILTLLEQERFQKLTRQGAIHSLNRTIFEPELYQSAAAADLVVAPYPRHSGRSSIILWAAAAGRPSLGTARGCIGRVIREQHLGLTCDVLDRRAFCQALKAGLQLPWDEQDEQRVRTYAQFHDVNNYQRMASTLVREAIAP